MSPREILLLLKAMRYRLWGLALALAGALGVLYLAPSILIEGTGDTAKALLVAVVTVFGLVAKDMSEGLKRDYTEFVISLRSAANQENES